MFGGVMQALGGLGLFLLGMLTMTEGLRTAADQRLRTLLRRSTKSPLHGVVTGSLATAILQSSSAVIVAAVGFANAGLLSFSEALGIIFGANIGTTITGWLVALLGFKLQLGELMLPVILVGVLLRFFGRGKWSALGIALAGFGLIFVGIGAMQDGMVGFRGVVTPDGFPADTIGGRILLVMLGMIITLITQSSSAGVATALVAVHAGSMTLPQAAAMVIGMDLGTTFKAAIATIGGNVQAKRTGFAHVVYNAMTAVGAMLLLTPYLQVTNKIFPNAATAAPELVLVGFHTFFNTAGVIAILPFTRQFANLIVRLFPERGNILAKRLDNTLLKTPELALAAVKATLQDVSHAAFRELSRWLTVPGLSPQDEMIDDIDDALEQTHDYLRQIRIPSQDGQTYHDYLACLHSLDHLERVNRRLRDQMRLKTCRSDPALANMAHELATSCAAIAELSFPLTLEQAEQFHQANHRLKAEMRRFRSEIIKRAAAGELSPDEAIARMNAARWLRRIGYHIWRVAFHASPPLPQAGDHIALETQPLSQRSSSPDS